jgi:hypothetical protein
MISSCYCEAHDAYNGSFEFNNQFDTLMPMMFVKSMMALMPAIYIMGSQ